MKGMPARGAVAIARAMSECLETSFIDDLSCRWKRGTYFPVHGTAVLAIT
jgi:hypothetical protein